MSLVELDCRVEISNISPLVGGVVSYTNPSENDVTVTPELSVAVTEV